METERVYQIFQRSIKKHNFEANIQYLSDGESKSYLSVKNVYKGLEIKKRNKEIRMCRTLSKENRY